MVTEETIPPCPKCGSNKHAYPDGERNFWCTSCKVCYDGIDDGEIGYGRPSKRMEREEARAK
jgi:tRNA(Ile2) C34 agmatinyltransferase TiaS